MQRLTKVDDEKQGALSPKDASTWINLGNVRKIYGDLKSAVAAYERALILDPENAVAWSNLASVRSDLGDLKGSTEALERAHALSRNTGRKPDIWPRLIACVVISWIAGFLITWGVLSLTGTYRPEIFWDFFSIGWLLGLGLLFMRIITWIREHDNPVIEYKRANSREKATDNE